MVFPGHPTRSRPPGTVPPAPILAPYARVKEFLKQGLSVGRWPPGALMPSESELVAQFDWLVRAAEQCKRVALMPPKDAFRLIDACSHRIRSVFTFAALWRNESITREDVRQDTQPAQRAKQRMGDLPQDVLAGSWRDTYAPVIGTKRRTPAPTPTSDVLPQPRAPSAGFFASTPVAPKESAKVKTAGKRLSTDAETAVGK